MWLQKTFDSKNLKNDKYSVTWFLSNKTGNALIHALEGNICQSENFNRNCKMYKNKTNQRKIRKIKFVLKQNQKNHETQQTIAYPYFKTRTTRIRYIQGVSFFLYVNVNQPKESFDSNLWNKSLTSIDLLTPIDSLTTIALMNKVEFEKGLTFENF